MLTDEVRRPLRFIVTTDHMGDITEATAFLEGQSGDAILAGKGCDSNALRETDVRIEAEAVIDRTDLFTTEYRLDVIRGSINRLKLIGQRWSRVFSEHENETL